jgi:methyl-accepting chemotaxis protein
MNRSGPLETVAWAAAGAALLGGGIFLGLLSAAFRRPRESSAAPAPPLPDPALTRRVEDLATAVAGLQQRLEAAAPAAEKIVSVSQRVDQLERRIEQMIAEAPAGPSLEQVLAAVEQMVAAKIGGLDERLTDQVHAIELLRHASAQTDTLLHRLIQAVEALSAHSAELSPSLRTGRGEAAVG